MNPNPSAEEEYVNLVQSTGPEFSRLECHTKSSDFRAATHIRAHSFPKDLLPTDVVIRNAYVGVNASDINATQGAYLPPGTPLPYILGFEGLGTIVARGAEVSLAIGTHVAHLGLGAFAEYSIRKESSVIPIPSLLPNMLALTTCGLTASIALSHVGEMKVDSSETKETIFITAAAGAVGNIACQLAKQAGHHVIGTCSSIEKVEYLKSIGCDRVINYKEEDVNDVLTSEYPKGIDLVLESVGGVMFETCVKHVATKGRIVVIGMISQYQDQQTTEGSTNTPPTQQGAINMQLLMKSASVRGFLLFHFESEFKTHMGKLVTAMMGGQLQARIDPTKFHGLDAIADAVDFMYDRKNIGKLVVSLTQQEQ